MKTILLAMVVLLVGCTASRQSMGEKPAMRALGEAVAVAPEQASDESIGAEVRRRLEIADASGTASVIVEVSDGVVTLRGSANGLTGAWRAEAVAHSVPGVKEVRNQIIISQTGL
jgi:osmotically-inducible protein OsmY